MAEQPTGWRVVLIAIVLVVSLSGRIRMHESAGRRPEEVVRELYEEVFGAPPTDDDATGGGGPGEA